MYKNLNLIKSIALFLVIVIHFSYQPYLFIDETMKFNLFVMFRSFLSSAVPLFLFTSGYLIINKEYELRKILKKIIVLILLLFLFKFLYALAFNNAQFSRESITFFFTTTGAIGYRVNSLWFMYALIGIFILLPIIQLVYNSPKLYTYLCLVVCIYAFVIVPFQIVFNANHNFNIQVFDVTFPFRTHYEFALGYFLIGGLIKQNIDKISKIRVGIVYLIILAIFSVFIHALISIYLNNIQDIFFDPMYDGYSLFTNVITSLIVFYILKFRLKTIDNKLINFIAKNSLLIYLLHWPITYYIKKIMFENININMQVNNFLASIIILIICIIITCILSFNKKLIHFLNGR